MCLQTENMSTQKNGGSAVSFEMLRKITGNHHWFKFYLHIWKKKKFKKPSVSFPVTASLKKKNNYIPFPASPTNILCPTNLNQESVEKPLWMNNVSQLKIVPTV